MTPRDIEKLKALKKLRQDGFFSSNGPGLRLQRDPYYLGRNEKKAWEACKAYVRSPEGMVRTHSAKEAWLGEVAIRSVVPPLSDPTLKFMAHGYGKWVDYEGFGDSPQAAVDALFWAVP